MESPSSEKDTSVYFDIIDGGFGDASTNDGAGMVRLGLDKAALRRVLKWLKEDLHFSHDTQIEFTPQDDGNVLVEVGPEGAAQRYMVTSEGLPVTQR